MPKPKNIIRIQIIAIKKLIQKINKLNEKIKKNPMAFYGKTGKELIITNTELHVLGREMMKKGLLTVKSKDLLQKIPLEN